jgi:hypothetical protein
MKQMKFLVKAAALALVATSFAAGAATYNWTGGPGNLANGGTGGNSDPLRHAQAMSFTYNENTQDLTVFAKWFNTSADGAPEGAWLVLSDGAMPSSAGGEVPIYYIDWNSGVNRVTTAAYDGTPTNGGGAGFGSVDHAITLGGCAVRTSTCTADYQSIQFTLNIAGANSYDPNGSAAGIGNWKGGDFASNVGVWFHWFDQNATNKYTYSGTAGHYQVTGINKLNESYYDTGGCGNATTKTGTATGGQAGNNVSGGSNGVNCNPGTGGRVPVPGLAYLLGLGLVGVGLRLRKQA